MLLLLLNLAASGGGIIGAGSIADGVDTPAAAGTVAVGAAGAASDGSETVAGSGSGPGGITGAGSVTDGPGTIAGSGSVSVGGSGSAADGAETVSSEEPDGLPISLDQAKASQKIETDGEDFILTAFLRAAIDHVESVTGKNLSPKTETQIVDGFPCRGAIRLDKGPVSQVLSVEYDDSTGSATTLAGSRLSGEKLLPGFGTNWPQTAGAGTVRVSYVAGYAPTDLPDGLVHAVLLLFGHFYANREAVSVGPGIQVNEIPLGVEALMQPHLKMVA